jgi:hypothetical protein
MAQVELEIPQTDSRDQIRDQVNWNQERNADMMVRQTTRKIKHNLIELKVGDFVTITVPKEDRQGLATPRIPGAINRVMLNGYYEIKTSGGIIDRKFRAENIGKYNGSIDLSNSEPTTLRNAAILFNNNYRNLGKKQNLPKRKTSTQSCNCKSGNCIQDKRCKCSAASSKCNSHCHLTTTKKTAKIAN